MEQPEALSERQCPGLEADGPGAGSLPAESEQTWTGSLCFLAGAACGKRGRKDRREGDGGDTWRLVSRRTELLGLLDKARAKIRDRGNLAGAALRAHDENEAERIIRIVGAVMELPGSGAELELLRKGDSRRVMCAATVKRRTSVKNDWLASRLRMGHPAP